MRFGQMDAVAVEANSFSGLDREEVSTIRNIFTLRPTSRGKIIGQDQKIRQVLETIDRVARSTCTVLVTGESGTGKELVVAALHDASTRRDGPMVTINCGAIPLELVESELFGHTRGAFTGAQQSRKGHVANAEGGTLFLDEVGELPMAVQVKLLRLLQQREYTPVGESRAIKCDVRIVAATNRDLEAEVAAGRFREDLYYRLNVIHIHLPALRERRGDARLLANHFFRVAQANSGREDLRGMSDACLQAIESHPWPGNVRALENAIERGVLLARGPFVEADDVIGRAFRRAVVPVIEQRPDSRREGSAAISSPLVSSPIVSAGNPISTPEHSGAYRRINVPTQPTAFSPVELNRPAPQSTRSPLDAVPASVRAQIPTSVAVTTAPSTNGPASTPSVSRPSSPMLPGPERRSSDPNFPRVLPNAGVDLFAAVDNYQNNLIRQALARTGGNKNRAAQLLGLNRTTLVEMIRRRGL